MADTIPQLTLTLPVAPLATVNLSDTPAMNFYAVSYLPSTGANGAGGGVTSLNGLSGVMNLVGLGSVFVTSSGNSILISGSAAGGISQGQLDALSGWAGSNLTNTGASLYALVTGLSGANGSNYATLANLTQTGISLGAKIDLSSGFAATGLFNSGSNLYNLIINLSGQANTNYATVSNLYNTGNSLIVRDLVVSGTLASGLFSTGSNLQGQINTLSNSLGLSGSNLYGLVTGLSGQAISSYATLTNVTQTGVQLNSVITNTGATLSNNLGTSGSNIFTLITGLSGQSVSSYATLSNLTQTGIQLGTIITNSGVLFIARDLITSGTLASGLFSTGSNLYALTTGLSGQSVSTYATLTNLTLTGVSLGSTITNSGAILNNNLGTTGSNLYVLITGLSGVVNNTYATLSNLTQTGVIIEGQLTSLSGYVGNVSGGLQAQIIGAGGTQVKITGSNSLAIANFSGVGNAVVILSGNVVLISGVAAGGSFDPLGAAANTGQLTFNLITGASGQANINFATILNVTQTGVSLGLQIGSTGQALYLLVTGLSGVLNASLVPYATVTNLAATGQSLYLNLTGLSGAFNTALGSYATVANLALTGQGLYLNLTGLSGAFNTSLTSYATITNLTITGQSLYLNLTGLSGQFNTNFATITNVTQSGVTLGLQIGNTGQALYLNITGMSGAFNTTLLSYATAANLTLTGQQALIAANNNATNLSGNLTSTGQALYLSLTGLSGQLNINHATVTNLVLTGQILYNLITGASGQANSNFAALINVTQTGVQLGTIITNTGIALLARDLITSGTLSSGLFLTGSLLSAVKVTGSNVINVANFTGIGNARVTYDGTTITISGIAGAGGGVTSLNSLAGDITIGGGGANAILTAGQTVIVSGVTLGVSDQVIFNSGGITLTGDNNFIWSKTGVFLKIGAGIILPNNPLSVAGTGNVYVQINLQNLSSGTSAQADYVVTADIGNNTNNFIDFGINNSKFADTGYQLFKPLDGFLYVNGGDIHVGTSSPNKTIKFHTDGIQSGNLIATISSGGIILTSGKSAAFGLNILGATGVSAAQFLSFYSTGWGSTVLGPALWNKQFVAIWPASSAALTIIGDGAPTVLGSATTVNSEILGGYTNFATAAAVYTNGGMSSLSTKVFRGSVTGRNGFFFTSVFSFSDGTAGQGSTGAYANASGSRFFIGLTDQTFATQLVLNDATGSRIGLNFTSATGGLQANLFDTNWIIESKGNASTLRVDSKMQFQTGFYRYSMFCPPFPNNGTVWYQLDDILRGSGVAGAINTAAALPVNTTALRTAAGICNASGVAKNLRVNNLYVETPLIY